MCPLDRLDEHPIVGISLAKLMEAVGPNAKTALVLPAVQRNAVWSPRRIVELWDSVLRGMPVGGFLVYRMAAGEMARAAVTNRADQKLSAYARGARYALFDGQQRLKALMLGWPELGPSRDLCLWIDLGAVPSSGKFAFRVTTAGRPFGYAANNEADLSAEDRREARRGYLAWLGIPIDQISDLPVSNLSLFNAETDGSANLSSDCTPRRPTPWKATRWTIPVSDLLAALRDRPDATLDDIAHCCACRYETQTSAPDGRAEAAEQLKLFRTALRRTLSERGGYQIPLQRVPAHLLPRPVENGVEFSAGGETGDALTTLFQRIGQNGVRLSDGDLAFSLIKQRYPHTHDAVRDIWFEPGPDGAPPVGALLDQTDIVLLAFRIARALAHRDAQAERTDGDKTALPVSKPSAADIQRMFDAVARRDEAANGKVRREAELHRATERRFLQFVPAFDVDQSRSIGRVLRKLIDILAYRGGTSSSGQRNDAGLPRPCLSALDFDLISILATWLAQLEPDPAGSDRTRVSEVSRGELLRFVLWWRLAVDDQATVAEEALRRLLLADRRGHTAHLYLPAQFPGAGLYRGLTEAFADTFKALALPIGGGLTYPTAYAEAAERVTAVLRSDAGRFGEWSRLESLARDAIKQLPEDQKNSAWQQWLPLHHREIAARFWWSVGKRPDLLLWLQRAYVQETFGDYDPLALRENDKPYDLDHINPRASVKYWGDKKFACITDETVRKAFRDNRNSLIDALGNYRVIEFGRNRSDGKKSIRAKLFVGEQPDSRDWERFALNEAHADLWLDASVEGTRWSERQILSFQAAVEARTENLYSLFWDELDFDQWSKNIRHEDAPSSSTSGSTVRDAV